MEKCGNVGGNSASQTDVGSGDSHVELGHEISLQNQLGDSLAESMFGMNIRLRAQGSSAPDDLRFQQSLTITPVKYLYLQGG